MASQIGKLRTQLLNAFKKDTIMNMTQNQVIQQLQTGDLTAREFLRDPNYCLMLQNALRLAQLVCHGAAREAGWWQDPKTGADKIDNPLCFSNGVALIHSEVSEALEGDRKSKMDEHLPQFENRVVELGDANIRIFDVAGGFDMDLPEAIVAKLVYNAQRADHKMENRQKDGGKAY